MRIPAYLDNLITIVVWFAGFYVIATFLFFNLKDKIETRRKSKLYKAISAGFQNATVDSVTDLINLYKGVYNLGTEDTSHIPGLTRVLRQYLVSLISENHSDTAEILKLKEKANCMLKQIESDIPFSDLPTAERNLILDIQHALNYGDQVVALQKIQELAGQIEIRQNALKLLQRSNRWSIPLAMVGLVLTLFFGVISLIKI